MRQDDEGIHLSLKEYCALSNAFKKFHALLDCGVEGWNGYEDALATVKLDDDDEGSNS